MASKWDKYVEPQQPAGDKWARYAEPAQQGAQPDPPAAESHPVRDFLGNFWGQVNPVSGLVQAATHPVDTARNLVNAQLDQFKQASADWENTREMPNVSDRLLSAGGHVAAGLLPLIGPAAARSGEQIGNGDVAGGLGSGAGLITSMLMPEIVRGTTRTAGRIVKAPASPLAESAMGVRGPQRLNGATPGRAILEDTTGLQPENIQRSAQAKVNELDADLERRARQSKQPASLQPARDVGAKAIDSARAANSESAPREMQPMVDQLTTPRPGFQGAVEYPQGSHTPISFQQRPTGLLAPTPSGQPVTRLQLVRGTSPEPVIAAEQAPIDLLGMKRQFSKDFIDNWNPNRGSNQSLGTAKQMYHAMDNELDRTVPGASAIDQRIQSLIPVIDRSELAARSASGIERALARIARPTGALAAGLTGMFEGGRKFGLPGALLGGAAGLAAPEVVSMPAVQMGVARGLYGAGKALMETAPVTGATLGNALRAGPLLRLRHTEPENR